MFFLLLNFLSKSHFKDAIIWRHLNLKGKVDVIFGAAVFSATSGFDSREFQDGFESINRAKIADNFDGGVEFVDERVAGDKRVVGGSAQYFRGSLAAAERRGNAGVVTSPIRRDGG